MTLSTDRLRELINAHANKENWGYSPETAAALRQLLAIREIEGLEEALEAGEALLILDAAADRDRSGRYGIGTDSFAKYDSRARLASRQADILSALAASLRKA